MGDRNFNTERQHNYVFFFVFGKRALNQNRAAQSFQRMGNRKVEQGQKKTSQTFKVSKLKQFHNTPENYIRGRVKMYIDQWKKNSLVRNIF